MQHTPEKHYDQLIDLIREAQDTLLARCEEVAQRCDSLTDELRAENATSKRNARISLIVIAVATAAFITLAAIALDSQNDKPTPAEKQPVRK